MLLLIVLCISLTTFAVDLQSVALSSTQISLGDMSSVEVRKNIEEIMQKYYFYDYSNGSNIQKDGDAEIFSLNVIYPKGEGPGVYSFPRPQDDPELVIVLVEDRIIDFYDPFCYSQIGIVKNNSNNFLVPACLLTKSIDPSLRDSLETLRQDLILDGLTPIFFGADLYDGRINGRKHQDGLTLLAIREFFRDVQKSYSHFKGAILVGDFPEAEIVRSIAWEKKSGNVGKTSSGIPYDHRVTIAGKKFTNTEYFEVVPEAITFRGDIVLSDLDGNWDKIYTGQKTKLPLIRAIPISGIPSGWPTSVVNKYIPILSEFDSCSQAFEDFFHVVDYGDFTLINTLVGKFVQLFDTADTEVSAKDRGGAQSVIAMPDIMVSRINAKNIAMNPHFGLSGFNGESLLDNKGIPEKVTTDSVFQLFSDLIIQDQTLERNLLIEYFKRNHQHRMGNAHMSDKTWLRAASISTANLGGGYWFPYQPHNLNDQVSDASIIDYVKWLKRPSYIRFIDAHSGPEISSFKKLKPSILSEYDLIKETGTPWAWNWDSNTSTLIPSFYGKVIGTDYLGGMANIYLYRTLWENYFKNRSDNVGVFYAHTGCDANTPSYAGQKSYTDYVYGWHQNMDALMFYANGIALLSRSKTFYDGMDHYIARAYQERIGETINMYYSDIRNLSTGVKVEPINRKRPYWWTLKGDWTLYLNYTN